MLVVLIGPSGVGKDTQAALLVEKLHIPTVSSGDLLRAEIQNKTEIGQEIENLIAAGNWASDEIIEKLIVQRAGQSDAENGFILTGTPRTQAQIAMLDNVCKKLSVTDFKVFLLTVPDEVAMERMRKQSEEQDRNDSTEEGMKKRLQSYHKTIDPIAEEYSKRGNLYKIDANRSIEEIHNEIIGFFG